MVFSGPLHPNGLICPVCRSRRVVRNGHTRRTFKTLPVGHKKVELVVFVPRLLCKDCGANRQAELDFADPKKHYTRSLERFTVALCRILPLSEVALFDPFDSMLTPQTRKRLLDSWPGIFRHVLLERMPAGALAEHFDPTIGRPSKNCMRWRM